MRIAQVAPLYESVPPRMYGGTERVVSYVTEELVAQGHEVTLYASGDSVTSARLRPGCSRSLRLSERTVDALAHHVVMLERVFQEADQFDVLHFHCDYLHFPLSRRHRSPSVTTLHGRLDLVDLVPVYREYSEMPLISISNRQREPLPWANWLTTVYHGMPRDLHTFRSGPGSYLAFLGRISPEKRVDRAIRIARRSGMELKIAAKVDAADREYFKEMVKPLLKQPGIEFVGEIGGPDKDKFLGEAHAMLFPIDWPEPFGLVMIEAMACGTPVIAWRRGSVSEVVEDGVTGCIVERIEDAVKAVERVAGMSRRACRLAFERRYTVERMVRDYLAAYQSVITTGFPAPCEPASKN